MTTTAPLYPFPDLVKGYIAKRRSKTFHVPSPDSSGTCPCGRNLAELIEAGWARGLLRQGLTLCKVAAGAHVLDPTTEEE
jgi:hypothetical protein